VKGGVSSFVLNHDAIFGNHTGVLLDDDFGRRSRPGPGAAQLGADATRPAPRQRGR
jgi:hypothetical protein